MGGRATVMPRTESQLVVQVIDCIRDMPRAHARKVHGSRFQDAGEPDVDACIDGRAVKIEVKLPGHVPSAVQFASMRRWEDSGALAGWVDTMDQLRRLVAMVGNREWVNPQLCRHREAKPGEPQCPRCGDDLVWS